MEPEEKGFPYYSPSKLGKKGKGQSDDESDDEGGEVAGTEEGMDTTPPTGAANNVDGDTCMDAQDESDRVRRLTNSSVRRQIIRPWEDSKDTPTSGKVLECPLTGTGKQNGRMSLPRDRGRRNSGVRTAAEALVAMATPTKDDEVIVDSVLNDVNASRKSCTPTDHSPKNQRVSVDGKGLAEVYERIVKGTDGCSVEVMERIHNRYQQLVFRHRMNWQRDNLLEVSS